MTDKKMCSSTCALQSSKLVAIIGFKHSSFTLFFLALSNWQVFTWQLFGKFSYPLSCWFADYCFACSWFLCWYFYDYLSIIPSNSRVNSDGQVQDAKLAASITSDREKQLEAKISTLETALEKALKKE